MNGSWIPSHLQLTIIQGREFALKSKNVNSEVYVHVQVDKEKVTTFPLPRHTHPLWNQTFEIPLMSLQSFLEIQVRQKSKFSEDFIGQIRIPITSLSISNSPRRNWYKLAARPGKTSSKLRGDILIATCFLSNWDLKESAFSNPIDVEIQNREEKMLRRTKSEYKSKAKDSPKSERSKQRSVFDRLRRNKSNAFEECEDFDILPVRTPQSPPTPVSSGRKKMSESLSSSPPSGNGSLSSLVSPTNGSDFKEMFTEAMQLEGSGVLDLSLVDPITRLEQGQQMFESLHKGNESVDLNETDPKASPILQSYSFRRKRPLRTQSLSIKPKFANDSTSEDKHHQSSLSTVKTSTPIGTPAVTYRATSVKRIRGKRNQINDGVSYQGSTTSVDEESVTSEYYSSTSLSENPSKSLSTVSIEEERKHHEKKDSLNTPKGRKNHTSNVSSGSPVTISFDHPQDIQKPESDKPSDKPSDGQFLEAPLDRDASRREKSLPTDTQREEVCLRKSRRRYASDTSDVKRHSADIESLLRLTSLSQGKNDGLGNVLNTEHIKMKLQRQSTCNLDSGHSFSASQPSDHMSVTRSANSTPPCLDHDQRHISTSHEVINVFSQENDIAFTGSVDQIVCAVRTEPMLPSQTESLPPFKRIYNTENRLDPPVTPLKMDHAPCLDKASIFESGGSSSTASTLFTPPSTSTSLDSSFSSDYASLSANMRIDDNSGSEGQCATPSSITPTISREETPSPELHLPSLKDGAEVARKHNPKDGDKKNRHTYNKSLFDTSKGHMPPLPPALKYATLPSRGKFADATKMTMLVTEAIRVLAPYETRDNGPANIRTKNHHPVYSFSASNSGRTSPVMEEREEEFEEERNSPSTTDEPGAVGEEKLPTDENRPVQSKPDNTKLTPSRGSRKPLASSQSHESYSLQRKKRGGGLQKTLSLYQDNRRQATPARRTLFKGTSIDNTPTSSALSSVQSKQSNNRGIKDRPSPKSKQDQPETVLRQPKVKTTANKEKTKLKATLSNSAAGPVPSKASSREMHELHHSTQQSNGFINSHTTLAEHQFDLPPPPDVSHTSVAERVCGLKQTEESKEEIKSEGSDNDESWKDSQSSLTSSSDDCDEQLCQEDLQLMNKESLIDLVLEKNFKLAKAKRRLGDTQSYLDSLLLKVMEKNPELLATQ